MAPRRWRRQERIALLGQRAGWVCQLCFEPVDPSLSGNHPDGATADHVIPRSMGGTSEPGNLRLAHRRCNEKLASPAHRSARVFLEAGVVPPARSAVN